MLQDRQKCIKMLNGGWPDRPGYFSCEENCTSTSPNFKLKMSKSQIKIAKSKLRADTKMSWATHHYDCIVVV